MALTTFPWLPAARKLYLLAIFKKLLRKYLYSLADLTNLKEMYISLTVFYHHQGNTIFLGGFNLAFKEIHVPQEISVLW